MENFDPSAPAILHNHADGAIVTWTGESGAEFLHSSVHRRDGAVEWKGFVFDGWDDVLGG
jgi:hypothetical protein